MFPIFLQSVSSTLYKRGKFRGEDDNENKLFCQCVRDIIAAECIQQEFTDKLWMYFLGWYDKKWTFFKSAIILHFNIV